MSDQRANESVTEETWFFLRGLVREVGHWSGFLEEFRARFPHRKVVALDLPGNGARFREASPLSVPEMARALREAAAPHLGEGKNYLFAVSLGAMVGVEWMNQAPEDFAGAVLVNSSLRGLSPFYRRLRPGNYGALLRIIGARDLLTRERIILAITTNRAELGDTHAASWATMQEARPVSVRNALRQLWAALRFAPPKAKPRPPLLILSSERDGLVHPSCSEAMAALWGAPILRNPRAGHDLTLDDPDWALDAVGAWRG